MHASMFAFGSHVTDETAASRHLRGGLALAAEPDTMVFESCDETCAAAAWSEILAAAAGCPALEGLVLVRDDVEIRDRRLLARVRAAFAADPSCGVIGAVGARSITSLRWWEGVTAGSLSTAAGKVELGPPGDVHAVDGALLALSPAAIRIVAGEPLPPGAFGHDLEICWRARLHGLRVHVLATDIHVEGPVLRDDLDGFEASDHAFRSRWSAA
jgi:hypothetical protein